MGTSNEIKNRRMTCAACGYDTSELYSGIECHKPFKVLEIECAFEGSPSTAQILVCPRCGTLRI